jgi:hypothetical protein
MRRWRYSRLWRHFVLKGGYHRFGGTHCIHLQSWHTLVSEHSVTTQKTAIGNISWTVPSLCNCLSRSDGNHKCEGTATKWVKYNDLPHVETRLDFQYHVHLFKHSFTQLTCTSNDGPTPDLHAGGYSTMKPDTGSPTSQLDLRCRFLLPSFLRPTEPKLNATWGEGGGVV